MDQPLNIISRYETLLTRFNIYFNFNAFKNKMSDFIRSSPQEQKSIKMICERNEKDRLKYT